jgi:hypothetical protein
VIVSAQGLGSRGFYRKPRADLYTVLLAIALVGIVIACVCLYLEVAAYGPSPYVLGAVVWVGPDHPAGPTLAGAHLSGTPPDRPCHG